MIFLLTEWMIYCPDCGPGDSLIPEAGLGHEYGTYNHSNMEVKLFATPHGKQAGRAHWLTFGPSRFGVAIRPVIRVRLPRPKRGRPDAVGQVKLPVGAE